MTLRQQSLFARTQMLLGAEGLARLRDSTVAVFGVGGVGSFAVEALARAGIGHLIIFDHDVVDVTNINRQLPALVSTVGQPKAQLMAARVSEINPDAKVEARVEMFTETDVDLINPEWDYVVDAIDMVSAKVALIAGCVEKQVPIVAAMGAGNKLDPTRFLVEDISKTHTCPLAKVVRQKLRQRGIDHGVKVVFSTERPQTPHYPEGQPGKRVPGSVSYVPPVAGMILASVVVNDLVGASKG
ncbi:MAG: tRNA threonylcarbamoyladenosine dehydratase [Firmicutes bacterium]|nr:tRNA threonylcarbamoyladenosine dehydratase [Bacillota bacterium]